MVSREDAKTSRIDGQALMDAKFGAEVGDPRLFSFAWVPLVEPGVPGHVIFQILMARLELRQVDGIIQKPFLPFSRELID
jgi:hypothetical protein